MQAVVGALMAAAALEAWPAARVRAPFRAPSQAALAGAVLLALGASPATALAQAFLIAAVALTAGGLAALGRRIGAGWLGAGAVGLGLAAAGSLGLFWADPLAEAVPPERRPRLRQAVLHLDPVTAAAYAEPGFDRLRSRTAIYRDVPLASSLIEAPRPLATGSAWLLLAVCLWGAARVRSARAGDPAAG